jgi:hypothetical protein
MRQRQFFVNFTKLPVNGQISGQWDVGVEALPGLFGYRRWLVCRPLIGLTNLLNQQRRIHFNLKSRINPQPHFQIPISIAFHNVEIDFIKRIDKRAAERIERATPRLIPLPRYRAPLGLARK